MAITVLEDVDAAASFEDTLRRSSATVCHFKADWCDACAQIDKVLSELSLSHPSIDFVRVDAERMTSLAERYNVSAVPYVLLFQNGTIADRVEGANVPKLVTKVEELSRNGVVHAAGNGHDATISNGGQIHASTMSRSNGVTPPTLTSAARRENEEEEEKEQQAAAKMKKLEELVNSNPIMLFMKGTAEEPRCGFSSQVVETLRGEGVEFSTFDILSDQSVREGLKVFSNWPTYPQLYVFGELLGGCDIIKEMHENGELKAVFQEKGLLKAEADAIATTKEEEEGLEAKLTRLISSCRVMLFMKGTPSEPRCGFSRRVVTALQEVGTDFGSFDILSDEEVRQGLKDLSNWPTYPQLYHKGEFIGGCDIVTELHEAGELKEMLLES